MSAQEKKANHPDFNMNYSAEENIELWQNLQQAGALWIEISQISGDAQTVRDLPLDPLGVTDAMADAWLNFWHNPERAMRKQTELWQGMSDIWTHFFVENRSDNPNPELSGGRMFAYEGWQSNMIAAFLRSSYLYLRQWTQEAVSEIKRLDEHEKIVAEFASRTGIETLNPANFAFTNPEVIDTTMREKGANLVRGLQMMREDLKRGKGQLQIRQVDYDAFEIGRNVAVTPGKVIYQHPQFQIIQYDASTDQVNKTPIMIIPPWINKYYILDLNEKKSYAKWIAEQGYTVFMVSWYNADENSGDWTWDKRLEALREGIDVVLRECDAPQAHLISFCIGGTMTGSLLADMDGKNDDVIASTTFLTSQFDFEKAGELLAFVSEKSVGLLDEFDADGYVPAESMSNAFNLLRSSDLIWGYVVNNYMLGKTPMAFDLLYWNSDSMRMPVQVQKFYLREFYLKNAFMRGELPIGENQVGVNSISVPTYHLAAIDDHIAPAASVYIAAQAMKNADVRYVLSGSGHIAGVVNPPAQEKYGYWVNPDLGANDLESWRAAATQHSGSWWLDWIDWLGQFGNEMVPARKPGAVNGVIEDAPGSYVKMRFDQ